MPLPKRRRCGDRTDPGAMWVGDRAATELRLRMTQVAQRKQSTGCPRSRILRVHQFRGRRTRPLPIALHWPDVVRLKRSRVQERRDEGFGLGCEAPVCKATSPARQLYPDGLFCRRHREDVTSGPPTPNCAPRSSSSVARPGHHAPCPPRRPESRPRAREPAAVEGGGK